MTYVTQISAHNLRLLKLFRSRPLASNSHVATSGESRLESVANCGSPFELGDRVLGSPVRSCGLWVRSQESQVQSRDFRFASSRYMVGGAF